MMKRLLFAVLFSLVAVVPVGANGDISATYPVESANMNVRTLFEKHQNMVEEINLSVTRGSIATLSNDATRWLSYIADFKSYTTYIQGIAFLDWAVTHGRNYTLDNPLTTECTWTDNTPICDLLDMVKNARDEIALSTSSKKMPMHFALADMARWFGFWDGMESYIKDYLLVSQPLDKPVLAAEEALGLVPGFSEAETP